MMLPHAWAEVRFFCAKLSPKAHFSITGNEFQIRMLLGSGL